MLLDFKEIPKANTGNGDQDTFELFSRDFLENLGYEIIQHPDRGADGKKDMIIQELRQGISGTNILTENELKKYCSNPQKALDLQVDIFLLVLKNIKLKIQNLQKYSQTTVLFIVSIAMKTY